MKILKIAQILIHDRIGHGELPKKISAHKVKICGREKHFCVAKKWTKGGTLTVKTQKMDTFRKQALAPK